MPVPTPPTFSQAAWLAGDDVLNTDWNQAINYLLALGQPIDDVRLSSAPGDIKARFAALADSFKVSAAALNSTLVLNYLGGVIKLQPYGIIAIVAPNTLSAPPNGISWVYCLNGTVAITPVQANPPQSGFLMAKITAGATAVTSVEDMRSLYQEKPDWDNRILIANKSTNTPLTIGGVPLGIPGWSSSLNTGGIMDVNSGEITVPAGGLTDIRIDASVLISCDTPSNLAIKLSLYANGVELKILGEIASIGLSLATRLSVSGFFETNKGETIAAGTKLTLQVQVPAGGTNTRVIGGDRNTNLIMRYR